MTNKSFSIRSKELKINGVGNSSMFIREYLKGKKIKILKTGNAHNYGPIGTIHLVVDTLCACSGGAGNTFTGISGLITGGNTIPFTNFTVLENISVSDLKEETLVCKKEKKDLDIKIKEIRLKIQFCEENNIEIFNMEEYKSFAALTLLEDKKLSKLEKAKLLTKLIIG